MDNPLGHTHMTHSQPYSLVLLLKVEHSCNGPFRIGINVPQSTITDLETSSVMALASNHSIAGWGWQQNNSLINGAEEQNLLNQAEAFYNFVNTNASNGHYDGTYSTFVYRSGFQASPFWNSSNIINDTQYSDFWMKNENGQVCFQTNSDGTKFGPAYNFSNASAVDYYLNNVIKQTFTNAPYINQVFFDMSDWTSCDYDWSKMTNCTDFVPSYSMRREFGYASINMWKKAVKLMNDNGMIPSISIRTVFAKYLNNTERGLNYCTIPEEEWLDALEGLVWFRYQEYWPDLFGGSGESISFLNQLEEIKYTQNKLAIQVHAYNTAPNTTIDPYFLATFLIAQQDYSYFGASNGWFDENWSWHDAYNVKYGKPLAMPTQLNDTAYFRPFEYCNITADIKSRKAEIKML